MLSREQVRDLFVSYKKDMIELDLVVDQIFLWQSENRIINKKKIKKNE